MILGLGIAFNCARSSDRLPYLPPEKNNRASSLINLFRNLGGSFGVAFVATMLAPARPVSSKCARRAHLGLRPDGRGRRCERLRKAHQPPACPQATRYSRAQALIYATVQKQSALLAFPRRVLALCLLRWLQSAGAAHQNTRRGAPARQGTDNLTAFAESQQMPSFGSEIKPQQTNGLS